MMADVRTKKTYIITEARNLDYDDKLYVLDILRQHIPIKCIKQHADGSRINLDRLEENIINKIYHIIVTKIKAAKSNFLTLDI